MKLESISEGVKTSTQYQPPHRNGQDPQGTLKHGQYAIETLAVFPDLHAETDVLKIWDVSEPSTTAVKPYKQHNACCHATLETGR